MLCLTIVNTTGGYHIGQVIVYRCLFVSVGTADFTDTFEMASNSFSAFCVLDLLRLTDIPQMFHRKHKVSTFLHVRWFTHPNQRPYVIAWHRIQAEHNERSSCLLEEWVNVAGDTARLSHTPTAHAASLMWYPFGEFSLPDDGCRTPTPHEQADLR